MSRKSYAHESNDLKAVVKVKQFTIYGQTNQKIGLRNMLNMLNSEQTPCVNSPVAIQRVKGKLHITETDLSKRFRLPTKSGAL